MRPVLTDSTDTRITDLWFENWVKKVGKSACITLKWMEKLPLTSVGLIMAHATSVKLHSESIVNLGTGA